MTFFSQRQLQKSYESFFIRVVFLFSILLFPFSPLQANIVGSDLQNFNPTSSGLDFVTVHSSETLKPWVLNVGSFLSYATNSLPYYITSPNPSGQLFLEPNDQLVASDLHFALGLTSWWEIGFNSAVILHQNLEDSTVLGSFAATGLADLRLNTKVRPFQGKIKGMDVGLAFNLGADFNQIDNNPFVGDSPGPIYNIDMVFDMVFESVVRWGFNLGYRRRNPGTIISSLGVTPLEDQLTYSSGLAVYLGQWTLLAEIFGSTTFQDSLLVTDRELNNLQALAGVRWNVIENLDIHLGGGTEIIHGLGVPDVLVYGGVNWRLGPLYVKDPDSDGDGIKDSTDLCPKTPKAEIESINERGCSDSDGDGVFNDSDQCAQTEAGSRVNAVGCTVVELPPKPVGDSDGDGVPDEKDQCPGTASGVEVNDLGCDKKRVEDIRLDNLNFVVNTANLTGASQAKVQDIVQKLKNSSEGITKIIVEGHTDSMGDADYNQSLSLKRAKVVANILQSGVPLSTDQVGVEGYGEQKPIAENSSSAGRAKNRRV